MKLIGCVSSGISCFLLAAALASPSASLLLADEIGALKPVPLTPSQVEYGKGVDELSAGNLAVAEANFKKSLQLDPNDVGALLGLAKVAITRNQPKAAAPLLQKAVTLAPKDGKVQATWGHYLFWQKRYKEAEIAYKKATELDPHAVGPHAELGDLYLLGLHQPKQAVEVYRTALSIEPKNPRIRYTLSSALAATGDLDQAQAQLEEGVKILPGNPGMLQLLGDFLAKRGRPDQALDAFSKALAAEPNFVPARMARGDIFAEKGDTEKALAEYQAALRINPKLADAYTRMGVLQQHSERIDEAQKSYLEAVKLDSNQTIAYNNLAWLAANRKTNLAEAVLWARKAVELAPNSATCEDTLGWVYRAQGQPEKALTALNKASTLAPNQAEIYYHLGVVYAEKGQTLQATNALTKSLGLSKNFEGASDAESRLATLNRPR